MLLVNVGTIGTPVENKFTNSNQWQNSERTHCTCIWTTGVTYSLEQIKEINIHVSIFQESYLSNALLENGQKRVCSALKKLIHSFF